MTLVRAFVIVLLLAGCTGTQLSTRPADPPLALPAGGAFRFARAPLAATPGVAPHSLAVDAAARAALTEALAREGFVPASDDEAALLVDFTLRDGLAANVRRIDSPHDAARAVWPPGPDRDNPLVMTHALADAAFTRVLGLSVLLTPAGAGRVAWEGEISRSVAQDLPDGAPLERVLGRMARRLLDELPATR